MMQNPEIDKNGSKRWFNEAGKIHRTDGPAYEGANGSKEWWLNGKLHRTDGPAIEWNDGSKAWWLNDQRHRVDGPAVDCVDGYKSWYFYGEPAENKAQFYDPTWRKIVMLRVLFK